MDGRPAEVWAPGAGWQSHSMPPPAHARMPPGAPGGGERESERESERGREREGYREREREEGGARGYGLGGYRRDDKGCQDGGRDAHWRHGDCYAGTENLGIQS